MCAASATLSRHASFRAVPGAPKPEALPPNKLGLELELAPKLKAISDSSEGKHGNPTRTKQYYSDQAGICLRLRKMACLKGSTNDNGFSTFLRHANSLWPTQYSSSRGILSLNDDQLPQLDPLAVSNAFTAGS